MPAQVFPCGSGRFNVHTSLSDLVRPPQDISNAPVEDDCQFYVVGIGPTLTLYGLPWPILFSGVSGSSPHSGVSPDDLSEEEDLFDYVVEEVAGYEPTDNVSKGNPSVQVSRLSLADSVLFSITLSSFLSFEHFSLNDTVVSCFLRGPSLSSGWEEAWQAAPPQAVEGGAAGLP